MLTPYSNEYLEFEDMLNDFEKNLEICKKEEDNLETRYKILSRLKFNPSVLM